MEIFIDSADVSDIKKWLNYGVVCGVTTNPTIMLKAETYDIESGAKEIAGLVNPKPVSIEVTTNDLEEMKEQARTFAKWAPNIVVKIPVLNQDGVPCLDVIKELSDVGIKINATALLSFGQVALVTKAGATYASIFVGRVADEGHDMAQVIKASADWLRLWGYKTKIIAGSIRGVYDVQTAAISGAHVVTVSPAILAKMVDHKYTRETVRQFINDAQMALAQTKLSAKSSD